MKICFVIPARLESARFPNKIVHTIGGMPIIERTMFLADKLGEAFSKHMVHDVSKVLAIDKSKSIYHDDIKTQCLSYDISYFPLDKQTSCGSEKVKWVAKAFRGYDYYITLPTDEPFMEFDEIKSAIENIIKMKEKNTVYTLFSRFYCKDDLESNLSCKILTDTDDKTVLYTSRAVIPAGKDGVIKGIDLYKKHLGVFVFPKQVLKQDVWKFSSLALHEGLEQNMFLNREFKFKVEEVKHDGFGIDTPEQIEQLEKRFGYNKR